MAIEGPRQAGNPSFAIRYSEFAIHRKRAPPDAQGTVSKPPSSPTRPRAPGSARMVSADPDPGEVPWRVKVPAYRRLWRFAAKTTSPVVTGRTRPTEHVDWYSDTLASSIAHVEALVKEKLTQKVDLSYC